jgi:hypothetical protein
MKEGEGGVNNTTPQKLSFAVERLNDGNVAKIYRHELEVEPLNLDDNIGYTRKSAGKAWFNEECKRVKEEKNACRAIHRRTRKARNKCRQAQSKERNLFKEK